MVKFFAVNGEILPVEEANIQITDLGLLRGYAIFDFLKVQQGIPLFIEDHLARLQNSAKYMRLQLNFSLEELRLQVLKLIAKNEYMHGGVKLVLTGGYSEDGYLPSAETNCIILLSKITPPSQDQFAEGVKLMLHEYVREMAEVKTTNYIVPIRMTEQIKAAGAFDVLYHLEGNISESSRSNFFIVNQKNQILTPNKHVLKGITRKRLIEVARQSYEVIEQDIFLDDLKNAKEAFMSSTTKGALPVVQVDDIKINDGQVGEISRDLLQKLVNQAADYIHSFSSI